MAYLYDGIIKYAQYWDHFTAKRSQPATSTFSYSEKQVSSRITAFHEY